jgi:two-component system, NtrC family, sensor kinase
MWLPYRLGPKLILSLMVPIVLISSISGYLSLRAQKSRLVEAMELGADQLSKSIASATWHAMLDDHREAAYEIMGTIAEKQGIDRIRMFNREGRLVFSTDSSEHPDLVTLHNEVCQRCHDQVPARVRPAVVSRVRFANSPRGVDTLNMITPIYNERACANAACHAHPSSVKVLGVLDVALRLDPVKQQAKNVTMEVVLSTAGVVLVGAAFVIIFVRRFVAKPIRKLVQGAKAVSAMELDRPIEIRHQSQELDELVDAFNAMRERVKRAIAELNEMAQTLEHKVAQRTDQLKAAQHKLLQADRLASLGQLAASVAHEINNPVSGVLNLSMLVERIVEKGQIPAGREAEVRKYLSQISTETARVGRIVSDLLSFSRRSKPQHSPADLNKLVRTTVALIGHRLKLIDAVPVMNLQEGLPLVECDASQVQQVVLNLVLNAAESMQSKGGGTLTISTRVGESGRDAELQVQDTGEGIAPEHLTKIFDPFFTTKSDGKGVGLGLAVLYGIVKAHDGEVEVSSKRGVGTTFTVTLPLKPNSADKPAGQLQGHAV